MLELSKVEELEYALYRLSEAQKDASRLWDEIEKEASVEELEFVLGKIE